MWLSLIKGSDSLAMSYVLNNYNDTRYIDSTEILKLEVLWYGAPHEMRGKRLHLLMIIPCWDPRKLLMAQKKIKIRTVSGMTRSIVI